VAELLPSPAAVVHFPARENDFVPGFHLVIGISETTAIRDRARLFWLVTHCDFKGLTLFAGHPEKSFLTSGHAIEQISFSSAYA
jgi:hypothetical protein